MAAGAWLWCILLFSIGTLPAHIVAGSVMFGIACVCTSLIALVASIARQARGSYTMGERRRWMSLVLCMGGLAFVLGLILIFTFRGESINFVGFVLIGLALNLLLTFTVGILALVLSWSNIQFTSSELILQGKLPAVILSLIYIVVISPFCEEFIFRGVCLRSFGRMGNYFAIFASSLLFSFMHGNLINILPSFCLGVFLAVVTMRFNSILPPLLIHIAINLQTVALQQVPVQYSWIIGLSCVVIYALALIALIRVRKEANPWILIQQFFLSWAIVITLAVYGVLNILTIKM